MRVCLFEDQADSLEPLSLTRPVFDLRCGLDTLAQKHLRRFASGSVGVLIRRQLADVQRLQYPDRRVNDLDWLTADTTVLVNGRWLPAAKVDPPTGPAVAVIGEEIAYAVLGREQLQSLRADNVGACLGEWKTKLPAVEAGGRLIRYVWELVDNNGAEIGADFPHAAAARPRGEASTLMTVIGPLGDVLVDPTARIEPLVVADTSGGPVVIDRGAVVAAFTRLEGPCYVGPHTHVLGAKIRAGTTLGPHCRIGGEVEASIVHGYSNKYHDGFLGHSYIGEWVNLGAGTHNSDLRNDYGAVTVTIAGQPIATGRSKVGCFLGDHTKTGLGTLLNTGTNVGVFCNLLPAGRLAPKYVPSFASWSNDVLCESFDWCRLLNTADIVMRRRGCALSEAHEALYRGLFADTAADRRRALREAEQRRLRRSA